jgi:hypothetical protein
MENKAIRIFFAFLIIFVIANSLQFVLSLEEITVEGKIIKTNYNEEKHYLEATFDNGKTYRLSLGTRTGDIKYVDLTVNSKLILNLQKGSWWLMSNTDNVWTINEVIKVPDN